MVDYGYTMHLGYQYVITLRLEIVPLGEYLFHKVDNFDVNPNVPAVFLKMWPNTLSYSIVFFMSN